MFVAMTDTSDPPPHDASIGERLRWLRAVAGITAREADRLADKAEGHVSLIESPERRDAAVKTDTATAYADVFGVSLDWLVNGRGNPPRARAVRDAVATAQRTKAA